MMGSDEVSAMVLDVGTCTTRVGFAGEDTPKCMFDTACGQIPEEKKQPLKRKLYVGRDKHRPREFMEVTSPLVDGLVEDWEALEAIYDYSFHTHLRVDPTDHPLMIAEPNFNTAAKREKTLELVFETFRSPATYFGKAAVLSAFSLGRTTALILDSGAGVTTTVPVHDGYVLNKGVRRTRVAGQVLDAVTEETIFGKSEVPARYCLQREVVNDKIVNKRLTLPNITPSYDQFMKRRVIRDLKETMLRVAESGIAVGNVPIEKFELPDGTILDLAAPRFDISECLFQGAKEGAGLPGLAQGDFAGVTFKGCQHLVAESVQACDVDIRKEMYGNLVLTGGTSLIPGFGNRLVNELSESLPPAFKVKVVQAPGGGGGLERTCAAWVGGSVLGSLGSFHQMWFSRQEYAEQGACMLSQKCP